MSPSHTIKYYSEELSYDYKSQPFYSDIIAPHIHNGWEFLYVKQGELSYTVDGNVFDVTPGNLIITRPGAVHMLHSKGTIHYERHDLMVSENLLNKTILKMIPRDLHILDISEDVVITGLFEKNNYYWQKLPAEYIESILYALSNELWLNIYIHLQAPAQSIISHSNPVIEKATEFIKDHIQEPLTVRQVSEALYISPTYLQQCFTKHINITPKQYILLQKLQLVHQALANGANPTEIYRHYGFHSYSTFYRNYQKIYGCSPSDSPKQPLQYIEL